MYHYLGKKNIFGQTYLTRNINFEPSSSSDTNLLKNALKGIDASFKLNKPAILCSHRVNFIGSIVEKNRKNNLFLLDLLFKE